MLDNNSNSKNNSRSKKALNIEIHTSPTVGLRLEVLHKLGDKYAAAVNITVSALVRLHRWDSPHHTTHNLSVQY
ncbi:hypothetical protein CEXT_566171 [Caerostris extrusa]|uniref:Uncharacterized protein n=1 Tax=Caerostris extrusa TaxID=172846 RepID=A0AAV4W6L5_CAEEX|nr:hypothetical protein CEXT_566171 [Caerostris extrusa]